MRQVRVSGGVVVQSAFRRAQPGGVRHNAHFDGALRVVQERAIPLRVHSKAMRLFHIIAESLKHDVRGRQLLVALRIRSPLARGADLKSAGPGPVDQAAELCRLVSVGVRQHDPRFIRHSGEDRAHRGHALDIDHDDILVILTRQLHMPDPRVGISRGVHQDVDEVGFEQLLRIFHNAGGAVFRRLLKGLCAVPLFGPLHQITRFLCPRRVQFRHAHQLHGRDPVQLDGKR